MKEYTAGVVFEKDKIIKFYTRWEQVGNAEQKIGPIKYNLAFPVTSQEEVGAFEFMVYSSSFDV